MTLPSLARLLALAAIWGASFLFIRIGAPVFGPGVLIELRVGIAALFLWLVCRWWRGRRLDLAHWRYFAIIGLFNSALPFVLYAYAGKTLSASLLSILNSATPTFGAIVSAVWLRQRFQPSAILGLAIGIAGVACVAWEGIAVRGDGGWTALAAGLTAPLCYGIASAYSRRSPVPISAEDNAHGSMWASTWLVLPLALLVPAPAAPAPGDWFAVAALGIVCTGYAFILYFRLVDDIGPTGALSVAFLIPVFGVLWGVLFLDEQVGWNTAVGGLLVLLGTALTNGVFKRFLR